MDELRRAMEQKHKAIDEQLKQAAERSAESQKKLEQRLSAQFAEIAESNRVMQQMQQMLMSEMQKLQNPSNPRVDPIEIEPERRSCPAIGNTQTLRNFNCNPKVEFPKFDGTSTNNWIRSCGRYFELCKINEEHKVHLASLHMTGKAMDWINSYLYIRTGVGWNEFTKDVLVRFKDETGMDALSKEMDEFSEEKIQQQASGASGNSNLYSNLNCNFKLEFTKFEVSTTIAPEMFDEIPKKGKLEVVIESELKDKLGGKNDLGLVSDDFGRLVNENAREYTILKELDEHVQLCGERYFVLCKIPDEQRKVLDCVHDTYKLDLKGNDLVYDSRIVSTFGAFPRVKLKLNVLVEDMALIRSNGNCSPDHTNEKGLTCFAIDFLIDSASSLLSINGLVDVYKKTLKSEGVASFYRGFNISCVGIIVYHGLYFGIYDSLKPVLLTKKLQDSFFASSALGWVITNVAGLASYHIDTVLGRMMLIFGEAFYSGNLLCCGMEARTYTQRSFPLNSLFGSGNSLHKDGGDKLRLHSSYERLPKNGVDKTFLDMVLYTMPPKDLISIDSTSDPVHSMSSGASDSLHGQMEGIRMDSFIMRLAMVSSAVNLSSQGSGHDNVFIWGGYTGDGVHKVGSNCAKMDFLLPKGLESAIVFDVQNIGHGVDSDVLHPKFIDDAFNINNTKIVACSDFHTGDVTFSGNSHTAVVTPAGQLFTFGDGTFGVVGHGDKEAKLVPTCVTAFVELNFCQVTCGYSLTVAGLIKLGKAKILQLVLDLCEQLQAIDKPVKKFDMQERIHSFFYKAAELCMIGLTAGTVQGALSYLVSRLGLLGIK